MKLKSFYPRFVLVNLILPFNLVVGLVFIIMQMSIMVKVVDEDGLEVKKFLHEPLLNILEEKEGYEVPRWIGLVAMDSGMINFFPDARALADYVLHSPPIINRDKFNLDNPTREDLDYLLANVVKKIPEQITIISFSYKGQEGMAIYMHDLLPLHMRVLQRPIYLGVVFLMTLVLFFLGVLQMNSHQRSIKLLIRASERIKNKDLDTEISVRHRTDMNEVFEAFDQMRRALKNTRDRESRFIMSVTHDLKTPLSAMRMYLEAMNDGYIEVSDEAKDAVGKVLAKSSVLESRIGELLEYMRLQSTAQEMDREMIDLSEWLGEQCELYEEECRLNDRNFIREIDLKRNTAIRGNRKVLNRALQNLIDNGCRYTDENDTLSLKVSSEGERVNIILEDNGPGIDEEERDKIFELFYRGDRGRNSRGMGIGLSSVRSILEIHGGSISCGVSESGGASFRLSLPVENRVFY